MRIGHGYDVHRLVPNRKLILGGVCVPFELGLLGHSDADVLIHAVMDALLGAAALGDIGKHFPDNDNNYKDISSLILLEKVRDLIAGKGYKIINIDATILAQKPKLATYLGDMVCMMAKALRIEEDCINVKATTEEGLGFTGSLEGIAAHAVCLLEEEPI
ncbi:MAG: 2-C-methyl-D-erythritol 2,4-cyclodiphosphate synthase [Lachnospiraceae bacterium]|nr:2-C-methyl-D-erythritol 2,4-cyclodiphosphate synthase [Lachnospiraceae bacterium]